MLPKFIFQARENLVEKPWGGDWIAMLKGFRQSGIGESWEFSAHPANPSDVIINGKTVSLIELFAKAKEEILGELAKKYTKFPILVKLLDINRRISVQVHPSDKVAQSLGEEDTGKDEAWLLMSTGTVYIGFKEDVTFEQLEEIVKGEKEKIFEIMNKFEGTQYDTFVIPAGTIHCAEGVRLLEVSTNSNITYRICDFSGRPEDIEKGKKALNFNKTMDYEVKGPKGKIQTEKFSLEVLDVNGSIEVKMTTFNIVMTIEGFAILKSDDDVADLHKGYSCLIPASTRRYIIEGEKAKIVKIQPL